MENQFIVLEITINAFSGRVNDKLIFALHFIMW